jgi:hypothetical protein
VLPPTFRSLAGGRLSGLRACVGVAGDSMVWPSVSGCGSAFADLMLTLLTPRQVWLERSFRSSVARGGLRRLGSGRTSADLADGCAARRRVNVALAVSCCGESTSFECRSCRLVSADLLGSMCEVPRLNTASECHQQVLRLLVVHECDTR